LTPEEEHILWYINNRWETKKWGDIQKALNPLAYSNAFLLDGSRIVTGASFFEAGLYIAEDLEKASNGTIYLGKPAPLTWRALSYNKLEDRLEWFGHTSFWGNMLSSNITILDDKFLKLGRDGDATLPTPSVDYRGKMIRVEGGGAVSDKVYVCIWDGETETYRWFDLVSGGFA